MARDKEHLINLTADEADDGVRLDVFAASRIEDVSREKIKKLVTAGNVQLNGSACRPKDIIKYGDVVCVEIPPPEPSTLKPIKMDLDILYEDEDLIVINKPAGLSVHPGAGEKRPTLVHGLLHHHSGLAAMAAGDEVGIVRPGVVHRLDKDTTGAIVVAKNEKTLTALSKQFHDKTNDREYIALLDGMLGSDQTVFESYLRRDPLNRLRFASITEEEYEKLGEERGNRQKTCRYAKSRFVKVDDFLGRLTLAKVVLYTGRTHQIRVHAVDLNAPILGDRLYHGGSQLPSGFGSEVGDAIAALNRQMLHARLLGFTHPTTGKKIEIKAPFPDDFKNLLKMLAEYRSVSG